MKGGARQATESELAEASMALVTLARQPGPEMRSLLQQPFARRYLRSRKRADCDAMALDAYQRITPK